MAVSRQRLGLAVVCVAVLVGASLWSWSWYQAKQEREVYAPQRLFEHLREVRAGEASLQADYVQWVQLKPLEIARIEEALAEDLRLTPHPEPDRAVALLLPAATAHLDTETGALSALESWLRVATNEEWGLVEQQSERWLVRAGEPCLELVLQQSEPEVVWQWVAVAECPAPPEEISEGN